MQNYIVHLYEALSKTREKSPFCTKSAFFLVKTDNLPTFTSNYQRFNMAELHQFTLSQLKELIEGNDEHLAYNYITHNLAIARNVKVALIKDQFTSEPTLLPEMRILLITHGSAHMTLNMIEHHFVKGDLVYLGNNGIIQYNEASDDVQAIGLSMSDDLLQLAIGNCIPEAFDGHLRDFHLHLSPDEEAFYDRLHQLIGHHVEQEDHNSQVTLHLVSALLWYVNHLWHRHEQNYRSSQSREQRLFTDFTRLVSQYATQHHTLDFYASQLCLTPRYLSAIIKQVSGKSAKQWIDDTLVTHIKIDLRHTDKSMATIAEEMNFPNPSFLTKFFKRKTGITPSQFQHS